MTQSDSLWMAILCVTGAMGHFTLIKCYEVAEASAVQPFAYLQLVFASAIGLTIFGEVMELNVMLGASIVVMAGLFTLWRERQKT
jgi:drug/metabolite transporter (DMT)-like permease